MNVRSIMAAVVLAATAGLISAKAQDGTMIGLRVPGMVPGEFDLVTVNTSTGQVTTLATETGIGSAVLGNNGYNILNNTFSFEYGTLSEPDSFRLRTVDATIGKTISDIPLNTASSSFGFLALSPLTSSSDFTTIATTGLATLSSASVSNDLAVGGGASVGGALNVTGVSMLSGGVQTTTLSTTGLATLSSASVSNDLAVGGGASVGGALNVTGVSMLSGGVQTTTVNAATSVTTPIITATTGNIQTVNVGAAFNAASGSTINIGGNRIQNVAAPTVATDAATKGYVDTSVSGIASSFNSGLNQALKKIDQNSQGIAIAMAMSGLSLSADKNAVIGGNLGFYNGKQAAALQGAIRVGHDVTINGGIGFGIQDKGQVGGRVGFQVEF